MSNTSAIATGAGMMTMNNSHASPMDDEWASDGAHLPGYSNLDVLFENRRSIVLRGVRNGSGEACIIKLLNAEFPSALQLWLFEQQYELTRSLSHLDGVVRAIALESYRNTLFMVFEDAGGRSLREWMSTKPSLTERLQVAIQIAAALSLIHQHNVVHRDINSNNIVYNAETKQLQVIDFGISILLSRESPKIKSSNMLEGTLQYISPEQTGRMNRSLDYRTDLYSFGVLLFEMLCGRLPFPSNDPTELVHAHIATRPPQPESIWNWSELPGGSAISKALSSIVMRLLAKNKEDRYQSGLGVKVDLEACLHYMNGGNKPGTLTLHGSDTSSVLQIPERLYGRDNELRALMTCFNRVRSTGRTEMATVAGAGGVGKSRVVGELLAMVSAACATTAHTPIFAAGKFDQFTRRPFSAIIAAVSQLVDYVLSQDAAQLAAVKARMLHHDTGLGGNASVAIQLVPSVALITGPQPAPAPLGQTEAQNRLQRTFVQLLRIFATSTSPLVLFVDDLQWSDQPSLQLLQQLATESDFRHCFVIAAYRDNEVSRAHPLTEVLDAVAKNSNLTAMALKPLTRQLIATLISDTLRCGSEEPRVTRLAQICLSKTHGNPFFVIELIRSLYSQGILNFDTVACRWEWDEERAAASKTSRNVVEMMAHSIRSLPPATQSLLKLASCIGTSFDLPTLATISGLDPKDVVRNLWKALVAGLVVAAGDNYFVIKDDSSPSSALASAVNASETKHNGSGGVSGTSPTLPVSSLAANSDASQPTKSGKLSLRINGGGGTGSSNSSVSGSKPSTPTESPAAMSIPRRIRGTAAAGSSSMATASHQRRLSTSEENPDDSDSEDNDDLPTKPSSTRSISSNGGSGRSSRIGRDRESKLTFASAVVDRERDRSERSSSGRPSGRTTDQDISVTYRFLHDRVRQAAYSLVSAIERPSLHLRIGRLMLKKAVLPPDFQRVVTMADDELLQYAEEQYYAALEGKNAAAGTAATTSPLAINDGTGTSTAPSPSPSPPPVADPTLDIQPVIEKEGASLMDICAHLNRGQLMVTDPMERWHYAELNCYLAHRTRESTAFAPALTMALYAMIFMGAPRRLVTPATPATGGGSGSVGGSPSTTGNRELMSSPTPSITGAQDLLTPIVLGSDHSKTETISLFTSAMAATATVVEDNEVKDDSLLSVGSEEELPHRSSSSSVNSTTGAAASADSDTSDQLLDDGDDQLLVAPPSSYDYDKAIAPSVWTDETKQRVAVRIYSLRLALEYAVGNFDDGDTFAPVAQTRVIRSSDLARLLTTRSISYIYRTKYPEAIEYALDALKALEVPMPPKDQWLAYAAEQQAAIKARVGSAKIEAFVHALPPVTSSENRLILSITADLSVLGYLTSPAMLAAISTRSVVQSFDRGLAAEHSLMYVWYGVVAGAFGERDMGTRFAMMTEYICERFRSIKFKGKSLMLLTTTIAWANRPLVTIWPIMDMAWQTGLSVGDYQWGGYQLNWIIHTRMLQGVPIIPLLARIPKYLEWCIKVKHDLVIRMLQAAQLIMFNLIGATPDDLTFTVPGPAITTTSSSTPSSTSVQLVEMEAGTSPTTRSSTGVPVLGSPGTTKSDGINSGSGSGSGSGSSRGLVASVTPRRQSRVEQRLIGLSPLAITEEEFLTAVEQSQLMLSSGTYYAWKSRVLYIYGYIDLAWIACEKSHSLRQFIQSLTPECDLIFSTALILLAKIGRVLTQRAARKSKAKDGKKTVSDDGKTEEHKTPSSSPVQTTSSLSLSSSSSSASASPPPVVATSVEEEDKQLSEWWTRVAKCQSEIDALVATCAENFTHMSLLLQAETCRWKRQSLKAIKLYGRAIDEAKKHEFIYHEALGAELFAEFWLKREDHNHAGYWLRRSIHSYRLYGARRKVHQLKQRHAILLDLRDMLLSGAGNNGGSGQRTGGHHHPTMAPIVAAQAAAHANAAGNHTTAVGVSIQGSSGSHSGSGSGSGLGSGNGTHSGLTSGSSSGGLGGSSSSGGGGGQASSSSVGASPNSAHTTSAGTSSGAGTSTSTSGSHHEQAAVGAAAAMVNLMASSPLDAPVSSSSHTNNLGSPGTTTGGTTFSPYISTMISSSAGDTQYSSPATVGLNSPHIGMSPLGSPVTGTTSSISRATPRQRSRAMTLNMAAVANATTPATSAGTSGTIAETPSHTRQSSSASNVSGQTPSSGVIKVRMDPTGVASGMTAGAAGVVNAAGHAPGSSAVANAIVPKKRGVNAQIDAQSMVDAAIAISQEMKLERALISLLNILLSCSGAKSGLLISKRRDRWVVEAKATPYECEVLPAATAPDDDDGDGAPITTTITIPSSLPSPATATTTISTPSGATTSHGGIGSGHVSSGGHGRLFASRTDANTQLSVLVQKRNHRARTAPHDRSTSSALSSTPMSSLPSSLMTSTPIATPVPSTSSVAHPAAIAPAGTASPFSALISPTSSTPSSSAPPTPSILPTPTSSGGVSGFTTRSADGSFIYRPGGTAMGHPAHVAKVAQSVASAAATVAHRTRDLASSTTTSPATQPTRPSTAPSSSPPSVSVSTTASPATSTPATTVTTNPSSSSSSMVSSPSVNVDITNNNGSSDENPKDASPAYLYRLAALTGARTVTNSSASTTTNTSNNGTASVTTTTTTTTSVTASSTYVGGFSYRPDSPMHTTTTTTTTPVTGAESAAASSSSSSSAISSSASVTTSVTTSNSNGNNDDETTVPRPASRAESAREKLAALSTASSVIQPGSPIPTGPSPVPLRAIATNNSNNTSVSSLATPSSTSANSTPSLMVRSSRSRTTFTAPTSPEIPTSTPLVPLGASIQPISQSPFITSHTNVINGGSNTFTDDDAKPSIDASAAPSGPARTLPSLPPNIDHTLASLWMHLPLSLFNFVLHTGKSPIVNDATTDRQFSNDPYVQYFKPKSVMVVPFILRNEVVSVLYLENNMTKGAFTSERFDMVKLLSSQAAISLENARLYTQLERHNRTLEQKVQHRTRQLREAQDVAERANMAKSLFLSTMSHEIRTPLNGVIGTTQLLLEQPQSLDVDQLEMVETIRDSGQTLLSLINDVLDLTKIESGKFELDLQPFDLRHCIESSMDVVAVKALAQGLDLAYFAPPSIPVTAVADVTRVRQILTNLLSNAVKFTAKGEVVVTVEATLLEKTSPKGSDVDSPSPDSKRSHSPATAAAHLAAINDDLTNASPSRGSPPPRVRPALQLHELHFAVRDTGIGIPMERAHRLFQIFSQVNTDTSKHYGGTGLGLAISRHFAEMMGGQVWVESMEGKGSTFHFTLRVPCSFENPPESLSTQHASLTSKNVWLVDPNAVVREQITNVLSHWGMKVTAFSNSDDFMTALSRTVSSSRAMVSSLATTNHNSEGKGDDSSSPASARSPSPSVVQRPDVALIPLHLIAGTRVTSRSPGQSPSSQARGLPTASGSGTTATGKTTPPAATPIAADGMKLIRRIRSHYSKRKLPIVLMCALSERKQEAKSVVNSFGSKPVKPGQLLKAVVAAIKSDQIITSDGGSGDDDALSVSPVSRDPVIGDYRPHSPLAKGRVLQPLNPSHRVVPNGPLDQSLSPTVSTSPGRLFRVSSSHSISNNNNTTTTSSGNTTPTPTTTSTATTPNPSSSVGGSVVSMSAAVAAAVLRGGSSPRQSPSSVRRLRAKMPSSLALSAGGGRAVRPLTILVAEDNSVNQKVIRQMLKMQGYPTIDIVDNGKKAVEIVQARAASCDADPNVGCYDLIFMDVQMPVMDGQQASKAIRESVADRYQPFIVALTAQVMAGDRDRCIAHGMSDYMSKPIAKEDLLRILSAAPRLEANYHLGGSPNSPAPVARQLGTAGVATVPTAPSSSATTPTTTSPPLINGSMAITIATSVISHAPAPSSNESSAPAVVIASRSPKLSAVRMSPSSGTRGVGRKSGRARTSVSSSAGVVGTGINNNGGSGHHSGSSSSESVSPASLSDSSPTTSPPEPYRALHSSSSSASSDSVTTTSSGSGKIGNRSAAAIAAMLVASAVSTSPPSATSTIASATPSIAKRRLGSGSGPASTSPLLSTTSISGHTHGSNHSSSGTSPPLAVRVSPQSATRRPTASAARDTLIAAAMGHTSPPTTTHTHHAHHRSGSHDSDSSSSSSISGSTSTTTITTATSSTPSSTITSRTSK